MKVDLKEISSFERELKVEVPWEDVAQAIDKATIDIAKIATLPGFRKGKTPKDVVASKLRHKVREEALNNLISTNMELALQQKEITPITNPRLFLEKEIREEKPFVFRATFEVKPKWKIQKYEKLPLKRKAVSVTEEDIRKALEQLQKMHALLEPSENPARQGTVAFVDYDVQIGAEKKKKEDVVVEIGAGLALPEIEEGLLGMRPGEEKEIPVHIPEEHKDPFLSGKKGVFHIVVKELKERVLLPLDQAFAEQFGVKDIEALQQKLRDEILEEKEVTAEQDLNLQIADLLIERNDMVLPTSLLAAPLKLMLVRANSKLAGTPLDDKRVIEYFKEKTPDLLQQVEKQFKFEEALRIIALNEGIAVEPIEIDEEFSKRPKEPETSEKWAKEVLADELLRKKTLEWLKEKA